MVLRAVPLAGSKRTPRATGAADVCLKGCAGVFRGDKDTLLLCSWRLFVRALAIDTCRLAWPLVPARLGDLCEVACCATVLRKVEFE